MARLAGVGNTRQASPKSLLRHHHMQVRECLHADLRSAQFHMGASHSVEHPTSDHDHDAWCDLDMNDFAVGALLAVLATDTTSIQWMPAVEDLNFLPDMGRMTQ